jgi:hypothetical protein
VIFLGAIACLCLTRSLQKLQNLSVLVEHLFKPTDSIRIASRTDLLSKKA